MGTSKFCTKLCEGNSNACGVLKHGSAKFKVDNHKAYIKVSDAVAFCNPTLETSKYSEAELNVIFSTSLTGAEWESSFKLLDMGQKPQYFEMDRIENDKNSKSLSVEVDLSELVSPSHASENAGIFAILPSLSYDSVFSEASDLQGSIAETDFMQRRIKSLEHRFKKIKEAWTKPFADVEASYLGLVADIKLLDAQTNNIRKMLGEKTDGSANLSDSLWKGLEQLSEALKIMEGSQESMSDTWERTFTHEREQMYRGMHQLSVEFKQMKSASDQMENRLRAVELQVDTHNKRFTHIRPLLTLGIRPAGLDDIMTRLIHLEEQQQQMVHQDTILLQDQVNILEALVRDQAATILVLENRVVGSGVQLGDFCFQSFDDLLLWVKKNLPLGRFGLIVDGHSFLEFFSLSGHIDTEVAASAEHNADKAGYSSYYEMKVAASFNNLFPLVFGKPGATGLDDTDVLPGITSGDKWNNGSTGVHHQIMRKMNDVSYQLDSNIKQVYRNYPEARKLATDCVTAAKRFVIDFIAFVSQEYSTWQTRGFTKRDSWKIVCHIIRRIFEDLESARVSARHVRDKGNMEYTAASIIFASLKCHAVMQDYVQHQFHEHPAISSVITRHLAANFVKPESASESRTQQLEKQLKQCTTKLDQLESKFNAANKSKNG